MQRLAWLCALALGCAPLGCDSDGSSDSDATVPTDTATSTSTSDGATGADQSMGDATTDPFGGDSLAFEGADGPPPALAPELLAFGWIGGAGDQFGESASFDDAGNLTIAGAGWTLTWTAAELASADPGPGTLDGDVTTAGEPPDRRPNLPGSPGREYTDPRVGLDFTVGYRQAGGNLQMPIFRAFDAGERIWALWGHAVADAQDRSLGADTRCYQAWGMPDGNIGVQCWTDGGNSVLATDPRDLDGPIGWNDGAWQRSAGGMSSLYALVDPTDGGSVVSGTFVASHVAHLGRDAWGRLVIGRAATSRDGGSEPSDVFGVGATSDGAGILVLDEALQQPLLNARLGGTADGCDQYVSAIAVRDGLVALAGTTCASDLQPRNGQQDAPGGGQDALVALIRLY